MGAVALHMAAVAHITVEDTPPALVVPPWAAYTQVVMAVTVVALIAITAIAAMVTATSITRSIARTRGALVVQAAVVLIRSLIGYRLLAWLGFVGTKYDRVVCSGMSIGRCKGFVSFLNLCMYVISFVTMMIDQRGRKAWHDTYDTISITSQ